jgi:hypothetical protein
MAIDTSIYGMIERPKVKSPQEFQADAYTLRNLGQENELRSQQIATARALEQQRVEKMQREQSFRQRLGEGASDQQLYEADPEAAGNFFETQSKIAKESQLANSAKEEAKGKAIANEQNEYKMQRDKLSDLYNRLSQVKDEQTYYNAINQGFDDGVLDMQLAHELVDHPFNLEEIQGLSQKMLTDMQRLEIKAKLQDLTQKQKEDPLKLAKLGNEVKVGTPDPKTNLTAIQMEEQRRAKAQQEFQAKENAANRNVTMRGQNMTDARTRELTDATRQNKPLAEYETRNFGFFDRARQAGEVLKGVEENIARKGVVGQAGIKFLPNVMQSEENQVFEQAKRQFIAAYLRRDSGAVITPSEISEADRTLFVQPGDSPKVIEQKRKARETITNGLKIGAGRAPERVDGAVPASKMVKLIAPNGQTKEVSEAEAEHYLKLGAKRAN